MSLLREDGKRLIIAFALASAAALAALALTATAPASAAGCPTFRALHNDRIGSASLPAGNYELKVGELCSGTFTVNTGPLLFPKGQYLVYIPANSGITCRRASVLFTRFLASPGGELPAPWLIGAQTGTFFKATNPERSAFRIEPLNGA